LSIGKLALRLVEKKGSLQYKSSVICFVYILWTVEPLQSIVEVHLLERKAGQQSGDFVYGFYNPQLAIVTNYVAGQSLDIIQKMILDFILSLQSHGVENIPQNYDIASLTCHSLKR
jgi:hypothetical protein